MQLALIADIHANALALETILTDIQKRKPDGIVSLGDQLNLGPKGPEVCAMLREAGATMLRGNHERYIESARKHDPAYNGANFAFMRHESMRTKEADYLLPSILQIEHVTLCHALPEDDAFPVYERARALPLLQAKTFDKPTTILCGHGHNPITYSLPNLFYACIGSAGSMDAGTPGNTRYTLATIEKGALALEPIFLSYDTSAIPNAYIEGGLADEFPIMSRLACVQQMQNYCHLLPFIRLALSISRSKNEALISEDSWQEADRTYPWPDGTTAEEFWKNQKRKTK